MPQKRRIRPPKANVGAKRSSESPPKDNQVPPKATSLFQAVQKRGGTSYNMWASCPK
jgi:hypothetical protein